MKLNIADAGQVKGFANRKKLRHHQHHLRWVTRDVFVSILFRRQGPDRTVLGIQNFQSESSSVRVGEVPGDVEVGPSF